VRNPSTEPVSSPASTTRNDVGVTVEALVYHLRGVLDAVEQLAAPLSDGSGTFPQPAARVAGRRRTNSRLRLTPARDSIASRVSRYVAQKAAEGLHPEHVKQTERVLKVFATWAAGRTLEDLSAISRADVVTWRETLMPGRSPATVNAWLTLLGGFLRWAESCGYRTGGSLVTGLKLRRPKAAREARSAFSRERIAQVFDRAFLEATEGRPGHRWIPLIMLFSGARPEEIAQLRCRDVREIDGYLVLDLATLDDGQRRKSDAARRLIPVHRRLVELGLLELLAGGRNDRRLFPELNAGKSGRLALSPSRWFCDWWLRKHKGIRDKRIVLYSVRHSVATELKRKGVEESLIAELLGHSNGSMTTGRYGKRYQVEQLARAVELLPWEVASE
jgi:integrase